MKKQLMLEQLEYICEEYVLEAKQTAAGRKHRSARVLRAVLIAACACVVLIGGAFAVTELIVNSVDVEINQGQTFPSSSGEEIVQDGYKTESEGIQRISVNSFSEEICQLDGVITKEMETLGAVRYYFENWNEMEGFLGIDVMNNPVLEAAAKNYIYDRPLDKTMHCSVMLMSNTAGEIERIHSGAYYTAERGTRADGTEYEVAIHLYALMYTEHYESEIGISGVYYYEGTEFEIFEHALPCGEIVEIVWVDTSPEDYADQPSKSVDHYDVHFAINGINYFLTCSAGDEEKTETLEILKQVLDGFL